MKLSVFMPTIRSHLLQKWYDSLEKSCNEHSFEVVMCGPFQPPTSLLDKPNVKFIKDYGNPTRAAQIAAINCQGDFIYHVVDDIVFFPLSVSEQINNLLTDNTILAMRYMEGQNHSGYELPEYYWYAGSAYPWPGVNPNWGNCVHFIMKNDIFTKYGGFDCNYEYLNHAAHDLLFRIQRSENVEYKLSNRTVCSADWMPDVTGDHAPIHYAQINHDSVLFQKSWYNSVPKEMKIDIINWRDQPSVWNRRFVGTENSYEELGCK